MSPRTSLALSNNVVFGDDSPDFAISATLSDAGSSELDYDSSNTRFEGFTAEEDSVYAVRRDLLVHSTKELFDHLTLVRCRSDIPRRMLQRFPNEVADLRHSDLVYMDGSPPWEAYLMTPSPRRWNWLRLQSNQIELQTAFAHTRDYYEQEFLTHNLSNEEQVTLVEHVEALAVLYMEHHEDTELVTNRRFATLLIFCAWVCLELGGVGGDWRFDYLQEVAEIAQREQFGVQPLQISSEPTFS